MTDSALLPRRTGRRLAAVAATAAVATLSLSACGSTSDAGGGEDTFVLGVSEVSTAIPFLSSLDAAITEKAESLGMETVVLDGEADVAKQIANIHTLISQQVDAILVISGDPTAPVAAIADAQEAGIPVFAVNAELDDAADVVTYIGASDFDYGRAQGELLLKALPDGGQVAVILGLLGGVPQVQRLDGLMDAIAGHPEIEIVAQPSDDFDNQKNLAVVQDLLSKYPEGSLDAIVAQGPQVYVGANYAQEQGRDDVLFIAGDYPTQIEEAIKSGAVYGTVDQSPVTQGERAAEFAHAWLTGKKDQVEQPESVIELPAVTKDNVDENPSSWGF